MFERLIDSHNAVARAAQDCATLAAGDIPPDMTVLAAARWALARQILEHVSFKDRHVYVNLAAAPDPQVRHAAERLRAEQDQLHDTFRSHFQAWTSEAVQADWQGFRRAMMHVQAMLFLRIKQEEIELHPLVARAEDYLTPGSPAMLHNWARDAWDIRDGLLRD